MYRPNAAWIAAFVTAKNASTVAARDSIGQHVRCLRGISRNANQSTGTMYMSDAVVPQSVSMNELIERVMNMTARKRGPRKGFMRKPVMSETVDRVTAVA
jgi:hypothetical protein